MHIPRNVWSFDHLGFCVQCNGINDPMRDQKLDRFGYCEPCSGTHCPQPGCGHVVHVCSEPWFDGKRRCSVCETVAAIEQKDEEMSHIWAQRLALDAQINSETDVLRRHWPTVWAMSQDFNRMVEAGFGVGGSVWKAIHGGEGGKA